MIRLNNGVMMPNFGLGTFKMANADEIKQAIKQALEIGYRHIDTAQMYNNEKFIGAALKEANVPREEIFLTTKLIYHYDPVTTEKKIIESLNRLQVDYLDLLLIHWPSHDNKVNVQTWKVFEKLHKKGIIKAIGLSNFNRYQLEQLLPNVEILPAVNQIEVHPALSQVPTIDYLTNKHITTIGYGPLMRGLINEEPFNSVLMRIAQKYGATVPQVVIAWELSRNIAVITKTSNLTRLEENFKAQKIQLDLEDIETINNLNIGKRLYSDPENNVYGDYKE